MNKEIDSIRFTEGPCDDDDAPDFLKNMRKGASLRARKRSADKNLAHVHGQLFIEVSRAIADGTDKAWTEAEDDAVSAFVDVLLLHLCNGGLFDTNQHRPSRFYRGSREAH